MENWNKIKYLTEKHWNDQYQSAPANVIYTQKTYEKKLDSESRVTFYGMERRRRRNDQR